MDHPVESSVWIEHFTLPTLFLELPPLLIRVVARWNLGKREMFWLRRRSPWQRHGNQGEWWNICSEASNTPWPWSVIVDKHPSIDSRHIQPPSMEHIQSKPPIDHDSEERKVRKWSRLVCRRKSVLELPRGINLLNRWGEVCNVFGSRDQLSTVLYQHDKTVNCIFIYLLQCNVVVLYTQFVVWWVHCYTSV